MSVKIQRAVSFHLQTDNKPVHPVQPQLGTQATSFGRQVLNHIPFHIIRATQRDLRCVFLLPEAIDQMPYMAIDTHISRSKLSKTLAHWGTFEVATLTLFTIHRAYTAIASHNSTTTTPLSDQRGGGGGGGGGVMARWRLTTTPLQVPLIWSTKQGPEAMPWWWNTMPWCPLAPSRRCQASEPFYALGPGQPHQQSPPTIMLPNLPPSFQWHWCSSTWHPCFDLSEEQSSRDRLPNSQKISKINSQKKLGQSYYTHAPIVLCACGGLHKLPNKDFLSQIFHKDFHQHSQVTSLDYFGM